MIANGLWLVVFGLNTKLAFILALVIMFVILVTAIIILWHALRTKLNAVEFITLRVGFSIYAGWVTAASIVSASIAFKSLGLNTNEETWTLIILIVALLIYTAYSSLERNFVFGAMYIWVLVAIMGEQEKFGRESLVDKILIILYIYIALFLSVTAFVFCEKKDGKCDRGLMF